MYWNDESLKERGISWNFPSNSGGKVDGLNDAGIELFRDSRISSLAREIIQNSLDAFDSEENGPIEVEFKLHMLNTSIFPSKDLFEQVLQECHKDWAAKPEVKAFFSKALSVINSPCIKILKVSDYKTIGLKGSASGEHDFLSNWYSLIKAVGVCNKDSEGAGGSFGIGKYAPYACSDLRTVFYGTKDKEGNRAFQGKSILVSHLHNDDMTQGTGFFGIANKNLPIVSDLVCDLPEFYKRDNIGTDIFIAGFNGDDQWKEKLIIAVLENFFVAIHRKKLVVKIDDVIIDNSTMPGLINLYIKDNTLTAGYYKAVSQNDGSVKYCYNENFMGLGKIELYLLNGKELSKRVAMVRATGMKIEDRGNFRNAAKFSGVFLASGEKINDFLRKCEGPRHDRWIAERYSDDPVYADKVIKELIKWIHENVRSLVSYDSSKEHDIGGINEYLADNIPAEKSEIKDNSDIPSNTSSPIQAEIKRKDYKPQPEEGTSGSVRKAKVGPGDKQVTRDHDGDGKRKNKKQSGEEDDNGRKGTINDKGKENKRIVPIKIDRVRAFCIDSQASKYVVSFVPKSSIEKGYVELTVIGDSNEVEYAPIVSAMDKVKGISNTILQNGNLYRIEVEQLREDVKAVYEVLIEYKEKCAMEVSAYEYKMA